MKIFSIKSREDRNLIVEHQEAPFKRVLQKALAEEVTVRVHSQSDLENALAASQILFGKATEEQLRAINRATRKCF